MNDPQYQTGSSWALGGALRALGGALGSRYRRQKSAKNVPKIPKKGGAGGLYMQNSLAPPPRVCPTVGERVSVSAHACEREVDTTAQRAESPVEVQEQRERERKRKRIGMGQVSAMCAHAQCSRAPASTPHTQRAHARRSRALPVPHQKLGPGGRKGLLVATGHHGRRRYAEAEAHCRLIYD